MECRLCLDSQPSVELFGRPDPLVMNIWNCCQIEVKRGDGLPEKICSACEMKLSSFVQFRISCANANRTLNERLHNSFNRIKTEHEFDLRIVKNEVITPTDISNADNEIFPDEKTFKYNEKETVADTNIPYDERNKDEGSVADVRLSEVEVVFEDSSNERVSGSVDFLFGHSATSKCICDERFSSIQLLKAHVETSHSNLIDYEDYSQILKPLKSSENEIGSDCKVNKKWTMNRVCIICEKTLASVRSFRTHLISTHLNLVLDGFKRLKIANGNIFKKKVSKTDVKKKTKANFINCSMCDKKLSNDAYEAHILKHHYNVMHGLNSNEQINDEAMKTILSKASQNPKLKRIPEKCDVCGKMVIQLREHKKTHERIEGGLVCDICHKSYKNQLTLYDHKRIVHFTTNRVPCNICGKMYKKKNIKTHMITHSTNTRFECDYCGKKFKYKSALKGHIASHMGLKPHKCLTCSKSFKERKTLESHMLQHTGENPFKCELCPREFKQKSNLKSHLRHFHKEKQ